MSLRSLSLAATGLLLATPALAHTGIGETSGFWHGFAHPLGGIDHVLAMVTVGLMAAQIGGRALWIVPLAFMSMMAAGGALGVAGINLPAVETAIAMSIVVFGLTVALGTRVPVALATVLVGAFAVFHGHAHGAEMPETASGLAYAAGFLLATGLLHASGIGAGLGLARLGALSPKLLRAAGGGVALAGLALLVGVPS